MKKSSRLRRVRNVREDLQTVCATKSLEFHLIGIIQEDGSIEGNFIN